ncbi:MAG: hypothetical protein M9925_10400 [Chloroflexi bacterium]|nr:hypothetical protein [Chloroflexota bacterium]
MWQALTEELADTGLTIVAVALESRGLDAALPYIEAANPTYPCLVDRQHVVAELFGMVNVPTAVWINEEAGSLGRRSPRGRTTRSARWTRRRAGSQRKTGRRCETNGNGTSMAFVTGRDVGMSRRGRSTKRSSGAGSPGPRGA